MTKTTKVFECSISGMYFTDDPLDAAKTLVNNVVKSKDWIVLVKDIATKEEYIVDTEKETVEREY